MPRPASVCPREPGRLLRRVAEHDFIREQVLGRTIAEFLNQCPELVIVDEAHTSVSDDTQVGRRSTHQRYELLRALAKDPNRHLILVTATPHSGKEEGFRNLLGLLNPKLATIDLDSSEGRTLLAQHFVQRRRADIRHFLDEETAFPKDRQTLEVPYTLTPQYRQLFDKVLAYAREQVQDTGESATRQRVRWWSALALLRALASSPAAAAARGRAHRRQSLLAETQILEFDQQITEHFLGISKHHRGVG